MAQRLSHESPDSSAERARLKRIFVRVMIVQVVTLIGLWLLQSRFGSG